MTPVPGPLLAEVTISVPEFLAGLAAVGSLLAGWAFVAWDLWRRDDLDPGAKFGWAFVAVLLAWAGIVAYFLFRPRGGTPAERERAQRASDEFVARHAPPPDQPAQPD